MSGIRLMPMLLVISLFIGLGVLSGCGPLEGDDGSTGPAGEAGATGSTGAAGSAVLRVPRGPRV